MAFASFSFLQLICQKRRAAKLKYNTSSSRSIRSISLRRSFTVLDILSGGAPQATDDFGPRPRCNLAGTLNNPEQNIKMIYLLARLRSEAVTTCRSSSNTDGIAAIIWSR